MKAFVVTFGGAIALLCVLGTWKVAARMMNQPDDLSVAKGVLILAGLVGLAAAAVYTAVKSAFRIDGKTVGDKKGLD